MEENLDKLERLEQDALERWRIRSERAGLALDKLEGQIAVIDDPIGETLETIRRQEDAFEVCKSTGCKGNYAFLNCNTEKAFLTPLGKRCIVPTQIQGPPPLTV